MFKDPRSLFVASTPPHPPTPRPSPREDGYSMSLQPSMSHLWGLCAGAVALAIQRAGCA